MKPREFRLFRVLVVCLLLTVLVCCGEDGGSDSVDGSDDDTVAAPGDDDAAPVGDDDDDNDDTFGEWEPPADPGEFGPFEVGNTTRVFVDADRFDEKCLGPRELLTEIWYPILPKDRVGPGDRAKKMFGRWGDFVFGVFSLLVSDEEMENLRQPFNTTRDAPIAPHGPFPVVLYSHGNAGIRFQAHTTCEHLASRGFVVVAPDHTGNAFVSALPDRLVIYNPLRSPLDFVLRQQDLIFLLDEMTRLNDDDPEGMFTGMIDVEHAGLIGHSFGGNTVLEVFRRDPRFTACIAQAAPDIPWLNDNMDGLLSMVSLQDHTLPDYIPLMKLIWWEAPVPKAKIEFLLGGHYTFTDACGLTPSLFGGGDGCGEGETLDGDEPFTFVDPEIALDIVNTYTAAWLEWRLTDINHVRTITQNLYPDHINHRARLRE